MKRTLLAGILLLPIAVAQPAEAHRRGGKRYQPHHGIHTYADLDHCESTHGAGSANRFQFTASTWRRAGGQGRAQDASYAEQLERADAWQKVAGWSQWPSCARAMGLVR